RNSLSFFSAGDAISVRLAMANSYLHFCSAGTRGMRESHLVPLSSAIPAATKQQYDDDEDQKGCVVHIVLLRGLWRNKKAANRRRWLAALLHTKTTPPCCRAPT